MDFFDNNNTTNVNNQDNIQSGNSGYNPERWENGYNGQYSGQMPQNPVYYMPQNPDGTVYDNISTEYDEKKNRKKTRNRFIAFITFIVVAIIILSVAMALSEKDENKPKPDKDNEYGDYYEDTDDFYYEYEEEDIDKNSRYSPKFNDYKDIEIIQNSKAGRTPLTQTQIYNKCIMSTVMIYSYEYNQIDVPIASGTGTIFTSDGFIITNQHVVGGFTNFTVTTMDGAEYEASLVGEDEKTDLAVLKIEAEGLTPVEFGYVSETLIGENVSAIGNPSGLLGTMTTGIVSSLGRTITMLDPYTISHIQFDAPVSSGNSGGILVNEYGQVIGIVDAKYIDGNAEGLGFAISIDEAIPIVKDIMKNGKVTGRVRLGITYTSVTEERAKLTGKMAGLYVSDVDKKLPVGKSGLKEGDIITDINGYDVTEQEEFRLAIREMSIGDTITMTVNRNGEIKTIKTTVGAYND